MALSGFSFGSTVLPTTRVTTSPSAPIITTMGINGETIYNDLSIQKNTSGLVGPSSVVAIGDNHIILPTGFADLLVAQSPNAVIVPPYVPPLSPAVDTFYDDVPVNQLDTSTGLTNAGISPVLLVAAGAAIYFLFLRKKGKK